MLRRKIPEPPGTLPLLKRSKEVALCMSSAPRVVSTGVNMAVGSDEGGKWHERRLSKCRGFLILKKTLLPKLGRI
jgi:hypothetical protein